MQMSCVLYPKEEESEIEKSIAARNVQLWKSTGMVI